MAIAYYATYGPEHRAASEAPEALAQRVADGARAKLGQQAPAGNIYHAEGPTADGGWWVFDVWQSAEALQTFLTEILQPVLADAGIGQPDEVRQLPVWWESSQMGPPA